MKSETLTWKAATGWTKPTSHAAGAQLVILFAARAMLEDTRCCAELGALFPEARMVGCSTGGQIHDNDVSDDVAVALALRFERTTLGFADAPIGTAGSSYDVGHSLGVAVARDDLRAVMVISDGLNVNGSKLIEGLRAAVGNGVVITGGLAGDGAAFRRTVVVAGGQAASGQVTVVAFYGDAIIVGHGSAGGWDSFGPRRVISRAEGNVLYSLDGKPALDLYKSYLGEEADGLPGTALLYPLMVIDPANPDHAVVRTVLGVDHEACTMTFAGDIPQGWSVQLMRGHFDNLSEGAAEAARAAAIETRAPGSDVAAILVSCIGRRLLMGESIVDEVEAATAALGARTQAIGFYSYGEISPHAVSGFCELHNQTMTVTTLAEAA